VKAKRSAPRFQLREGQDNRTKVRLNVKFNQNYRSEGIKAKRSVAGFGLREGQDNGAKVRLIRNNM
jgi:ribosomal protein L5